MTPKRLSEARLKEIRGLVATRSTYAWMALAATDLLADRDAILEVATNALKFYRDHTNFHGYSGEKARAALKELAQGQETP